MAFVSCRISTGCYL